MENVKPSPSKPAIKWALIHVITSIVLTYVFQFMGMGQSTLAKTVGFIPLIAFLLLAQKEYRDQRGGYMTFGQGFLPGFLYALFSAIMLAIFIFVYMKLLNPEVLEQTIAAQKDKMVAQGLSEDQIETANNVTRNYGAIIGAVFTIIFFPIIGAVIALIGAAIFKKERSAFDPEPPADPTV